jgi:C-methyltransferase
MNLKKDFSMKTKQELKAMYTEHWKYMAVSTACKLSVFDHIPSEGIHRNHLCEIKQFNPKKFDFLIESLIEMGFLENDANILYLTEKSELLTEKSPDSLKYACINWSGVHLNAWQDMEYTIKTGAPSFNKLYGMGFFNYLNQNPEELHKYHLAMNEYAREDYNNLPDIIDFSGHKTIIDVGGGYGALVHIIKKRYPEINCVLFDLQEVLKNVETQQIRKISGSFFDGIPDLGDAIILSRVIHDWNDESAISILNNCYNALPTGGKVYLIENCTDKTECKFSLLSLNMSVMCDSFERTSDQYMQLFSHAGFYFQDEIKLNQLQTILIFEK